MSTDTEIKQTVKEKYGRAALRVQLDKASSCGGGPTRDACGDPITSKLYSAEEGTTVPEEALLASLGMRQSHRASEAESRIASVNGPAAAPLVSPAQGSRYRRRKDSGHGDAVQFRCVRGHPRDHPLRVVFVSAQH
jgi:hypothetical protein